MILRSLIAAYIFFLPFHAFIVTVLKCKYDIDMTLLRFWKEIGIIIMGIFVFYKVYQKNNFSLKRIYADNTLLGLTTAFILCSIVYLYFPFMEIKPAAMLGFRYDVFFFFAFIIGLYCGNSGEDFRFYLRTLFVSTFGIIIIFLPWYLFGDISKMSQIFGYSSEVSTYEAHLCLPFSQNVEGHHRFQATFGGPIRMSVFFTMVGTLFLGWIMGTPRFTKKQKYVYGGVFLVLLLGAIFYSYSKTSLLGVIFSAICFVFLYYKYVLGKKTDTRFFLKLAGFGSIPLVAIGILKWELFLHLGSMINRLDNLKMSLEMFFYNPIGYGLGIAGPASQIGNSIESAGSWQVATASVLTVHKFLPENWYVQILLEQGIIGFILFISLMILIGYRLLKRVQHYRDTISIALFTAYSSLAFMALFTHVYEEAATSYILFFFIGIALADTVVQEKNIMQSLRKRKKNMLKSLSHHPLRNRKK